MLWVRLPFRSRSTTLCDKGCQWLAAGRWFSPGPPVSSTNKTDRHDLTEILLKVALNTIKPTNQPPNLNNHTLFVSYCSFVDNDGIIDHHCCKRFFSLSHNCMCIVGDKLVLASTDFDRNQAEEVTILDQPSCKQIRLTGNISIFKDPTFKIVTV